MRNEPNNFLEIAKRITETIDGLSSPEGLREFLNDAAGDAGTEIINAKKRGVANWEWLPTRGLATENPGSVFEELVLAALGKDYSKRCAAFNSKGKWFYLKSLPGLRGSKRTTKKIEIKPSQALVRLKQLAFAYRDACEFLATSLAPEQMDRSEYHPQPMTIKEISEKLGISDDTVSKYLRLGEIRGVKVKGRWRVHKEDLDL